MSFYQQMCQWESHLALWQQRAIGERDVELALSKDHLAAADLWALLSPAAGAYLEAMAQRAHALTVQHFGYAVLLFTPLYLANYCDNQCRYCSFAAAHQVGRKKLSPMEIEQEARAIAATGLHHLLILTGESRQHSPVAFIEDNLRILAAFFSSIALEVYPLHIEEYERLIRCGADGLTMYQETYHASTYAHVHVSGPKRDMRFRLEGPERACQAGMRTVTVGALLGLYDWRYDVFFTGLHADYLQRRFPQVEISVSLPRLRPHVGAFDPYCSVSDRQFVQSILALRLFLPRAGITLSTREAPALRDGLIPLGITKMSAGSRTTVGGYTGVGDGAGQFVICDERSVTQVQEAIARAGYKAVFRDW